MGSNNSEKGLEKLQRGQIDWLRRLPSVHSPVVQGKCSCGVDGVAGPTSHPWVVDNVSLQVVVVGHVGNTDALIHWPVIPFVVFEDLQRCLLVERIPVEGHPLEADRQDDEEVASRVRTPQPSDSLGHNRVPSIGLVMTRRFALDPENVAPDVCSRLRLSAWAGDLHHNNIRPLVR